MNIFCDLGRGLFHPSKKVPSKTSWRTSWTWSPLNELLLPWKATVQWSPGAIPTAEVTAAKFNINWDACRRLPEGKQLRSEDMRTLRISMYIYIIYICVCVCWTGKSETGSRTAAWSWLSFRFSHSLSWWFHAAHSAAVQETSWMEWRC
jgi:hypothetical protein